MPSQLPPKTEPRKGAFAIAYAISFSGFAALNFVKYLLYSTPTTRIIGFPAWFWHASGEYSRFRIVHFIFDLGLALYLSYRAAHWYYLKCWQQANREVDPAP